MNAFFFAPTNEFLGKFKIGSAHEVPAKFVEFYSSGPAAPAFSYIEADGRTWTVVSLDPLQLEEGKISMETFAMRKQSSAEAREKELVVQGVHAPNIHELLQQVIFNQQRQLAMVRSIRWVIIGFGVWFITQFWLLPKLLIAR